MPPNLYARARHSHFIAHGTARAVCTRPSVHPLIVEGEPPGSTHFAPVRQMDHDHGPSECQTPTGAPFRSIWSKTQKCRPAMSACKQTLPLMCADLTGADRP